jgi:hypothetical protein
LVFLKHLHHHKVFPEFYELIFTKEYQQYPQIQEVEAYPHNDNDILMDIEHKFVPV